MRDMAQQRRVHRRRRARSTLYAPTSANVHRSIRRRPRAHARRVKHRPGRPKKVRRVGVQASTGKILYRGHAGGKFTRGSRGRRNYV